MRIHQKKWKHEQIGDFEVQENIKGFGVHGPGDKLPLKKFKTFRAARLYAIRADRKEQG
jgi:hypothetical protein